MSLSNIGCLHPWSPTPDEAVALSDAFANEFLAQQLAEAEASAAARQNEIGTRLNELKAQLDALNAQLAADPGNATIEAEFSMTDRFFLRVERDRYDNFNAGVVWRWRFR